MSNREVFNNSEGNFKQLQKELHFKIGEQYDLNEFNLNSVESTYKNGLEYENYQYIKEGFNSLFDVEFTNLVTLQYNADILCKVVYEFDRVNYKLLKSKIEKYTFKEISLELLLKDESSFQIVMTEKR